MLSTCYDRFVHSIGPVPVDLEGAGRGQGLEDVQFSAKKKLGPKKSSQKLGGADTIGI